MKRVSRRKFLGGALLTSGAMTSTLILPEGLAGTAGHAPTAAPVSPLDDERDNRIPVDFRYSPGLRQTAYCFPDDPCKSVMNEKGSLLYGFDREKHVHYFPLMIDFALGGMKPVTFVDQNLESPSVPIVLTTLERADAVMRLTTFATDNPGEGRVDNVLVEIHPKNSQQVNVSPVVRIHSVHDFAAKMDGETAIVSDRQKQEILLVAKVFDNPPDAEFASQFFKPVPDTTKSFTFHPGVASSAKPYRVFLRFPQQKQASAQLQHGLENPERQLASARRFWSSWSAFQQPVSWQVSGRRGEFVTACARNILQARELKDGKLTFQVGPTCYRGLWVVDGNFILEAARYLGYDKQAEEGLRTTWSRQEKSGQVVAGGGSEHYKDTAIAMFTLVRQCELSQDWSALREFQPNVVAALDYIDALRARARAEGGIMGRYGLLPKGFGDGGLAGSRDEFTNTLWTLAGLKAIGAAGEQQQLPRIARATGMYRELRAAFNQAATRQMQSYDGQFQYLPMLMKEDPDWTLPNPWDRPRPQTAQWALSHTIFPGIVFDPTDPIVRGHVSLMQAVRREGVPAETGWSQHEAIWNYNAAFVAEVYLWLGMKQAANDTFVGFLNHASPLYCWREEQPLQQALLGSYVGDMPHNWASAECIRYMRHVLALEDGPSLRLLAGVTQDQLAPGHPYRLAATPTRFGRLDLNLEPLDRKQGWRLGFRREAGPAPVRVSLPLTLGDRFHLAASKSVSWKRDRDFAAVDPAAREWSLTWSV